MLEILTDPIIRVYLMPLVATAVLAGAIRFAGGAGGGRRVAGAAVGVVFLWLVALTIGIADFPPPADGAAIAYVVTGGLVLGAAIDFWGDGERRAIGWWGAAAIVLGAGGGAWWLTGAPLWDDAADWPAASMAALIAAWLIVIFRLRHLAADTRVPTVMLLMAAAALGIAAAIAGDRADADLAIGLAAAFLGFLLWNWFTPTLGFGYALTLSGGGALLVIALRLIDSGALTVPAAVILGFVLFADTAAKRHRRRPTPGRNAAYPLVIGALSLLPIALALAAAQIHIAGL